MAAKGGSGRTKSGFAERFVERIPRSAHCADRVALASVGKCLAETPDMDIDGATLDFSHITPNAVEYLRARKHAAGPFEEKLQQAEFYRREMDLA
jgi:hypothetical protein